MAEWTFRSGEPTMILFLAVSSPLLHWSIAVVGLIFGLWLLTRGADWFVDGAAASARRFRMPPLLIGFLIVGFGTSVPEMIVSALASAQGAPLLALGNAYGSNIANILLILGISALVAPIAIHRNVIKRDLPVLLGVTLLTLLLCANGQFSRMDGVLLLIVFSAFVAWQIFSSFRHPEPQTDEVPLSLKKSIVLTAGGLLALLIASQILVRAARFIALRAAAVAGVDAASADLIIGLTVVAIGTSLPELMSSVVAMRKGQDDIALGNIVGSNFFNTLAVVGIALVIKDVPTDEMPAALRFRDLGVMTGSTLLLWFFTILAWIRTRRNDAHWITGRIELRRPVGILFLSLFVGYTVWVILGTHA
ncbi:MAG: calcium/sodium antiporter [Kiritimatiellia bacterium]